MHPALIEACLHRLDLTTCQLDDANDVGHDDGDRDWDDRDDDDRDDRAESDLIG